MTTRRPAKKKTAHSPARKKRSRAKPTTVSGSEKPRWTGTIADVTDALNLRERRVYQLIAVEGLPRLQPGLYDLRAVCRWYVRYLQRKIFEKANPPLNATDAAGVVRHKMLSIESELKSIQLAERREGLISVDRVHRDTAAIVAEIWKRILAISPQIAAAVVGENDLAISQVKIERTLKGALMALSQFDPDNDVEDRGKARSSCRVI